MNALVCLSQEALSQSRRVRPRDVGIRFGGIYAICLELH